MMRYLFGEYEVDIDVEKTRLFYEKAEKIINGCMCDGCCNYERASDCFPNEVKAFFEGLGVDLKKAAEIIPYAAENEGKHMLYGGFYHICGKKNFINDVWKSKGHVADSQVFSLDEDEMYSIAENYKIGFSSDCNLLEDGFPMLAIQMEILFTSPWVLEKENPYQ
ncbi:MAG: hypothetical protein NC412_04715 [Roseburia sp.]|nr:hypothetical protein [Roseburia sp.]MCM1278936.1 hypothetical protein [Robinsoniella sp.]